MQRFWPMAGRHGENAKNDGGHEMVKAGPVFEKTYAGYLEEVRQARGFLACRTYLDDCENTAKKKDGRNCRPLWFPCSLRMNIRLVCYLLEYWYRARAPRRPYFFRSLQRASLLRKPEDFSGCRSSGVSRTRALLMAWLAALAWPEIPPPRTKISIS